MAKLLFLLMIPALASGQVARQGTVLSGSGRPVAGASIWVCTGNVTVTLTANPPCTPAQNIYTDYAQTHLVTQPLLTDGLGNYLYYTASGTVTEVVTGPNTLGYSAVLTLAPPNAAIKPAASDAVVYWSINGSDANDGHSSGTAMATEAAACAALPSGNSSCSAGSGTIYALGGTFNMGGTSINLGSNIRIQGAGMGITVFRWTSNVNGVAVPAGTINSGMSDCSLSFSSAGSSTSTGIRINASDASPTTHNIFRNLLISFDSLGTGTAGIYASGSGPSNTDVNANRFDGIFVTLANQAVLCTNCENNYWNVRGENLGGATNVTMFQENGLNADEVGTIRMEAGSSNFTGEICYSTTGNNNIINLTCDQNKTGTTAINDTGGNNIFTVTTIGNPTLGTIPSTSQYRYADSTNGDNVFNVATLKLSSSGGGTITLQAPNTASNLTASLPILATNTSNCAVTGVTFANCSGFSFPVTSGATYRGVCTFQGTSSVNATSAEAQWTIPGGYAQWFQSGAEQATTSMTIPLSFSNGTSTQQTTLSFVFIPNSSGTAQLQIADGTAGDVATLNAGSFCTVQ